MLNDLCNPYEIQDQHEIGHPREMTDLHEICDKCEKASLLHTVLIVEGVYC